MKISDRIMLHDYVQSRERMHPHRITEESLIVKLAKGILCVSLGMLALWLVWKVSTPAGMAMFLRIMGS